MVHTTSINISFVPFGFNFDKTYPPKPQTIILTNKLPNDNKKVLIITTTAGAGHTSKKVLIIDLPS